MPASLRQRLHQELAALSARDRLREPSAARGLDFASNDYLGLARHPAMAQAVREALARGVAVGSGGSRLLRGNHPEHAALESEAAEFFGAQRALYLGSGYEANLALFSALPTRRGAVVVDERVHASVKEGVRAGFAKKLTARHNDVQSFEDQIRRARREGARDVAVAVESLYGMEGDLCPLPELLSLCRRHEALLVVDEAHATGVLGPRGRGALEGLGGEGLVALRTCGKALGASGALICGPAEVVRYLAASARPFIYSTAPSPIMAAAVRRALEMVERDPWRRRRLLELSRLAARVLPAAVSRWRIPAVGTHVLPLLIGADASALAASLRLREAGFDVRAVRPPTVPEGSARLRISLNCDLSADQVESLAEALGEAERAA